MTKTIELTLEKECDLKPGPCNVVKVDGKKIIVEMFGEESKLAELEILHKLTADAVKDRDRLQKNKRRISEVLAGYQGGLFKDAQEIDDFLKAERESWDR